MTTALPKPRWEPGSWVEVPLDGELDVTTVSAVRAMLDVPEDTRDVVVDLSGVTFIDCAGLGSLLAARTRLAGRLWLTRPSRPVTRLLRLTNLERAFAIVAHPREPDVVGPGL